MVSLFTVCPAGHYGKEDSCVRCQENTIKRLPSNDTECSEVCDRLTAVPNADRTDCGEIKYFNCIIYLVMSSGSAENYRSTLGFH